MVLFFGLNMKLILMLMISLGLIFIPGLAPTNAFAQQEEEYYEEEEYEEDEYEYEYEDEEEEEDDYQWDAKPKQKKWAVGLQLGFNFNLSENSDFWGNSFSFFLGIEREITKNFYMGLNLGFINWTAEYDNDIDEYALRVYPLNITANYYFPSTPNFRPYAGIETGMNYVHYKHEDYEFLEDQTNRKTLVHKTIDDTKDFGFAPVLGMTMPWGAFDMNFNLKYYTIFRTKNVSFLAINGGLTYRF